MRIRARVKNKDTLELKLPLPPMPDTPENRAKLMRHIEDGLKAANKLHLEMGGHGLKIKNVDVNWGRGEDSE